MTLKEALNELKKEIDSFKIMYNSDTGINIDIYNLDNNKKNKYSYSQKIH